MTSTLCRIITLSWETCKQFVITIISQTDVISFNLGHSISKRQRKYHCIDTLWFRDNFPVDETVYSTAIMKLMTFHWWQLTHCVSHALPIKLWSHYVFQHFLGLSLVFFFLLQISLSQKKMLGPRQWARLQFASEGGQPDAKLTGSVTYMYLQAPQISVKFLLQIASIGHEDSYVLFF